MQNINKTRGDIFILTTILIFRQKKATISRDLGIVYKETIQLTKKM